MAASTVIKRNLGNIISRKLFRNIALAPRVPCIHRLTPATVAVPSTVGKLYSTDKAKKGAETNIDQESPNVSDRTPTSELGYDPRADEEEEEYEHGIRQRVLSASLKHVLDLGWSKEAIRAGARDEGLSEASHGMFQKGGAEIVSHFYKKSNAELAEWMKQEVEKVKAAGHDKPKTRSFIQDAVETRLKMIAPYHSIWKEAMAIQTLPQNALESWKNLMDLSDDIWYYAGDNSTDFDWYTKRISLAACYKTTEIYMIQDSSTDFQNTWIFLDNRLNDLESLGKFKNSLAPFQDSLKGLFEMGRNVIGMNSRKR